MADDRGECGTVYGSDPRQALARVSGTSRTYFVMSTSERAGCPSAEPTCRSKAFVVGGDIIVTGETYGSFTCADYIGRTGQHRASWLPTADLVAAPQVPVKPADWLGHWEAVESQILIKPGKANRLHLDGNATFGAHDPERVKSGGINVGEFHVELSPDGDKLAFATGSQDEAIPIEQGKDDDCKVRMRRLGPYLLVNDNNACGGMNVSFTGVYRRTR